MAPCRVFAGAGAASATDVAGGVAFGAAAVDDARPGRAGGQCSAEATLAPVVVVVVSMWP